MPLLLIAGAIGLTYAWTLWLLRGANELHVNQNVEQISRRVEFQLRAIGPGAAQPKDVWEALYTELLSDPSVQAVCVFDFTRNGPPYNLRRFDTTPVPQSVGAIDPLLNADPNAVRRKIEWKLDMAKLQAYFTQYARRQVGEDEVLAWLAGQNIRSDLVRGYVYLDLSRPALEAQFRAARGPLLRRALVIACGGVVLLGTLGSIAFYGWHTLQRVRVRAELAQQGLAAERGLTAAVLAHEIRNPLAALRFQLHSLRRNAADPPRVDATCNTIDSELSRIQQLVQDYLTHEKAETMRIGPVDLSDAVGTLQSIMGEMLRTTNTQLEVVEAARDVSVTCDSHALRQVLMNLVLNAQQALGRGGRITIRTGASEGFGTIDVSDTGPGIPEEMRDRLFKPFQTTKKGGTGIGLALVKRFVDNFGGSVTVESQTGVGTTFHLRLPLAGSQRGFDARPVQVTSTAPEAAYH